MADETRDFDVLIVGAGIPLRHQRRLPSPGRRKPRAPRGRDPRESRGAIGGACGICSSWHPLRLGLHTFGFPWRPWTEGKAIAEAPLILKYLAESVRETGIDKHVLFRTTRLRRRTWSSE